MSHFTPLQTEEFVPNSPVFECCCLQVSEFSVNKKLSTLNPTKASGPDGIPSWLLKDNADIFAAPVSNILNRSFLEARLPSSWKLANISPILKQKQILDENSHLRPISLTSILSKVAEDFVVEEFVKPAVLKKVDPNQFGTIPGSNTTQALISMLHSWNKATDGSGATVRTVLVDFKKAFDLIDHHILVDKLKSYDIPESIVLWVIDFLTCRKQRVKLGNDCYSEWGTIPSGVPQGTKLGPWLFVIMINDLKIQDSELWKYVDDTTMSEIVERNNESNIQEKVDELTRHISIDKLTLNESKCKELRISFSKSPPDFDPITINNKQLEVVESVKLLGMHISNDLKWNSHISVIMKKANKRLYFLSQLKRSNVGSKELITFYCTCIRPVTEYGCPVFHDSLPNYLVKDIERIQKRAMRIIFPALSYDESLSVAELVPLEARRQQLTDKLFQQIISDPSHKLNTLLPPVNECQIKLRKKRLFKNQLFKTDRFRNSFITHNALKMRT